MVATSAPTNGLCGLQFEGHRTTSALSEYIMIYFPGERAVNMSKATYAANISNQAISILALGKADKPSHRRRYADKHRLGVRKYKKISE